MASEHKEIHLVVLQHGLWGVPNHFKVMLKHMEEVHSLTEIRILNSDVSVGFQTYAGVDQCGERLVSSIEARIAALAKSDAAAVTRISFIGYSLGGLINRYAVGRLYAQHFFDAVRPINFITIASPHLGVRKRGVDTSERVFNSVVPMLTSRSGIQMSLADMYDRGLPLLVVMCVPTLPFYKALAMFKRRQAAANIHRDRSVSYTTASFSRQNPYLRWMPTPEHGEKYPSLVKPSEQPYVKQSWTNRDRIKVALLAVVAPFLLPMWLLVVLPTLAGWSAYYASQYNTSTIPHSTEWLRSEKEEVVHQEQPSAKDPESLKTHEDQREYMITRLNELVWEKIDVQTDMWHSHAAIIVRNGKYGKSDVTRYIADTFARS
ncbi:hypothetical protein SeLEV6574_g06858 [Synchytrium endobioticum]|uniref:DUF676 domain-containing protein n=1 Tax=Synchytrium endobioticum TaxID=286115 RepID=A0A507CMQ3_9FUNG|nr:hypothetical protein SeLEV6574_g06858 [Synchytrium endobioticum]